MSKVKIQGNASGTGVVTLTAPNTNTDRTITLPDGDISLGVGIDDNATSEKLDITDTAVKVGTAVNLHTDYTDTSGSIIYTKDNGSSTALADPNYYALQISNPYTGSTPLAGQKPAKIQFTTVTSDGYSASGSIALVARGTAYGEGDIVISTGAASSPANHSTETVRFPSTGGIRFNGDTSTANSLDDYEEGTWDPVINDLTTDATMNTSETQASYTKVGNVVTVQGWIQTSSMTGVTGNLNIKGLPFPVKSGNYGYSAVSIGQCFWLAITAGQSIAGKFEPATSYFTMVHWDHASGNTALQGGHWGAGAYMSFSGTYRV